MFTFSQTFYYSRLFSLVEYATREEADTAIRDLDGKEVRGSAVRVAIDEVSLVQAPS